MWAKFVSFFQGFFGNIVADPVSSAKGVVQLAAAGATCYGMATGAVPINVGTPVAAGFAASGIHALGTNSTTGVESATAAKVEALINQAAAATPTILTITDHFNAIKDQAGQAQAILTAASEAASALAALSPTASTPVPASAAAPEPAVTAPVAAAPAPTPEQVAAAQATLAAAQTAAPAAASPGV